MSTTVKLHSGSLNVATRQLSGDSMAKAIDDWLTSTPPVRDKNPMPGKKQAEKK